jgi:hypothetical protein
MMAHGSSMTTAADALVGMRVVAPTVEEASKAAARARCTSFFKGVSSYEPSSRRRENDHRLYIKIPMIFV